MLFYLTVLVCTKTTITEVEVAYGGYLAHRYTAR